MWANILRFLVFFFSLEVMNGYQCRNCCSTWSNPPLDTFAIINGDHNSISCGSNITACKLKAKVECGRYSSHCYIREGMLGPGAGQQFYMEICVKIDPGDKYGNNGLGKPTGLRCDGLDRTPLMGPPQLQYTLQQASSVNCGLLAATTPAVTTPSRSGHTFSPSFPFLFAVAFITVIFRC